RATPTECVPFLGKPVSSTIQATTGPCFCMVGNTWLRTCSSSVSSLHGALATKWCNDCRTDWTFSRSKRAAIGSILLRSPGSSNPLQYISKGACRSSCPVAFARPSIYAAKRFSCGPGAERRDPTKQFYIRMFVYDPVVLASLGHLILYRLGLVCAKAMHAQKPCGPTFEFPTHAIQFWRIDRFP